MDSEQGCSSEEEEVERELADFSFEELHRARSSGFVSVTTKRDSTQNKHARANKNRPMEASSKKPAKRLRQVIEVPKKEVRDPRFESLCGTLDVERFRKRYDFLFDEELPKEREKLQKMLKKSRDPKSVEELKQHISWINKQIKTGSAKKLDDKILADHKKKEREAVKHGKRPFYLKKSQVREQRLIEKYNELKAKGQVEAFMANRRRRNAAKEHRNVPYRRLGDDGEQ
ncbi:unnamed protein product [Victoria cruziana]